MHLFNNWYGLPIVIINFFISLFMMTSSMTYPRCLTIAGSDSGGGAGIQADIKTMAALGVYATTAITSITVQNTVEVSRIYPLPANLISDQIEAVLSDIGTNAIKIGMVCDIASIKVIARIIERYKIENVVLDPVMNSTNGQPLADQKIINCVKDELMPLATVITPNAPETKALTGIQINSIESIYLAGEKLLNMGCNAAVIKGGFMETNEMADIYFSHDRAPVEFKTPCFNTRNTHGTGCTFSSAVAAYLAKEYDLFLAVREAKTYLSEAIWAGSLVTIGKGHGPVNHQYKPFMLIAENRPDNYSTYFTSLSKKEKRGQ